jgi:outer membrane protein assembly factor BamB
MGPGGDGALDVGLLPRGVHVDLELDWRRPVGPGYSSITVFGGRALTLEREGRGIWAVSVDVSTGDEIWRTPLFDPQSPAEEDPDRPASTPTTDGKRVFVIHPAGALFALAAADGAVLWSVDMAKEFGAAPPSYGMSTSPILHGGRLHVLVGGREGFNVLAFHPETGEVVLAVGHGSQGSYATPVMGEVGGTSQLVVPAGDRLYGMSGDGEMLWSQPGLPYPDRDPLLLPDDRVFLALQEFGAMLQVSTEPWAVRELWRSELLSNSYSPAVHHQGAVFGFGGGSLRCLAAATGETLWHQRFGDGAMVRLDDYLVVFGSMSGKLHLVAASREGYREAASLRVFPSGNYSPTPPSVGAGRIFLRGAREMAAVRIALPG